MQVLSNLRNGSAAPSQFSRGGEENRGQEDRICRVPEVPPVWLLGAAIAAAVWFWHASVIYTDDAFIYLTVARNWAAGFGPALNPGDLHTPVTSLAWAGLVAAVATLGPASLPIAVKGLATGLVVAAGFFMALSVNRVSGAAAMATPFAIVSVELIRYTVGLETHLALAVISGAIYFGTHRRQLGAGAAIIGFGFFCRGDVLLLALPLAAVWAFDESGRQGMPRAATVRTAVRAVVIGGAVIAAGLYLSHRLTGSWLPVTLDTKIIQGTVGPWKTFGSQWSGHVRNGLGGLWPFAPLALIGFFRLGRIGAVLGTFAVLQGSLYTILHVAHYPWYGWITEFAIRLALCCGFSWIAGRCAGILLPSADFRWRNAAAVTFTLLALVGISPGNYDLSQRSDLPAVGLAPHLTLFLNAAEFIDENVCRNESEAKPVVLTPAVGVLSYFAECAEYRDVNGLASPGLTKDNLNDWPYWVDVYKPDALVRSRYPGKANSPIRFPEASSPHAKVFTVAFDQQVQDVRLSVYLPSSDPHTALPSGRVPLNPANPNRH